MDKNPTTATKSQQDSKAPNPTFLVF